MVIPTVRPAVKSALLLACIATLAACYFVNTPLPSFLMRMKEMLIAAVILWSAGGWGTRALSQLTASAGEKDKPLTPAETFLFTEVLGLGILSFLMILLGVLDAWQWAAGWGLVGTGLVLSRPFTQNLARLLSALIKRPARESLRIWAGIGLLTGLGLSFLLALAPITYYDSLVYHFALPAAYLQAHGWVALPGLIYSAFPQTLEMLWTLGLLIGDDAVANLLAWALSGLLLLAITCYARRFLDASVGWVATAVIALMPAFLLLSSGGYVDVGLTLFTFMAFYAVCLSLSGKGSLTPALAGLFAGWAIGTKYTGGIGVALLLALLALNARQKPWKQTAYDLALYSLSALLVFVPWLIKNTIYVGNPVFPFFYQWGIKALNPWVNEAAAGYFAGITEYYARSWRQLPMLLADVIVNGIEFGRGIDVLGDYGWIPLFAFLPGLWLCRKLAAPVKYLAGFSAAYFFIWASTRPVLRFFLPISPFLALLVGYAWVQGIQRQGAVVRWISRGFMGAFLLSGLFLFFDVAFRLSLFPVAMGIENPHRYLARQLNYYQAAMFINTQTPLDSLVYVLGDQRGYYYRRHVWISPAFSKNPLVEWANAATNPQHLLEKLKEAGISHVVFNRVEFERLKSYPYSTFTAHGERNWQDLQTHLQTLYQDTACTVYAL